MWWVWASRGVKSGFRLEAKGTLVVVVERYDTVSVRFGSLVRSFALSPFSRDQSLVVLCIPCVSLGSRSVRSSSKSLTCYYYRCAHTA